MIDHGRDLAFFEQPMFAGFEALELKLPDLSANDALDQQSLLLEESFQIDSMKSLEHELDLGFVGQTFGDLHGIRLDELSAQPSPAGKPCDRFLIGVTLHLHFE